MRMTLLSTAILLSGAAQAATPIDGWYSSAFGGFVHLPENVRVNIGHDHWHSPNFRWGYDVGGRIGFKCYPLRYELEFTYLNADIEEFKVNKIKFTRAAGNTNAAFLMGNAYYDFPDMVPAISPYLSVGLGYGYLNTELSSRGRHGHHSFREHHEFDRNDNVFAYQASAGFTYNFCDNYAASAGLRYIGTTRADHFGKLYQAFIGEFGALYRFDGAQYQ
jgi:opacity protein-like surface antigen